jgi:ribosome-associated protein
MIQVNDTIAIFENKIIYKAIRSSGPGGQHVNKVSTAVVLQYDITCHSYPEWFIINLKKNGGNLVSKNGVLNIKARSHRSQSINKVDALNRMIYLFKQSAQKPIQRKKTQAPKRVNENRLLNKKKQSQKKQLRKSPGLND